MKEMKEAFINFTYQDEPSNLKTFFTIKEAAIWATSHLKRNVSSANISYLINYGKVKKYIHNGSVAIIKEELEEYYHKYNSQRRIEWMNKLGEDLIWELSFDHLQEKETTKHVHRLHPYKGKFIPQLVEYFLDKHTDEYKKKVYFKTGDIILDPFAGSGTTLVEANELGIHAIGVDISSFNAMINNCKLANVDTNELNKIANIITQKLESYIANNDVSKFEEHLSKELNIFNNSFFPVPEYKYKVARKEINPKEYGRQKEMEFLPIYDKLVKEYNIKLTQDKQDTFLDKWFIQPIRDEIEFVYSQIKLVKDKELHDILCVILSRTMRSCRSTTHADLATLKEAVTTTYYCGKHGKICKPIFSILKWWKTYCKDTIKRLQDFKKLRTDTFQYCLVGDSCHINIFEGIDKVYPNFGKKLRQQKLKGIFSSPPYVGLINYHEQHAYAYDLFNLPRYDNQEIGSLSKGQKLEAQQSYVEGVANVLRNCKSFMADDFDIFLVANDKYNLYPTIAEKAGLTIIEQFKRPVLNRTERDKGAYCEIIFHLKQI